MKWGHIPRPTILWPYTIDHTVIQNWYMDNCGYVPYIILKFPYHIWAINSLKGHLVLHVGRCLWPEQATVLVFRPSNKGAEITHLLVTGDPPRLIFLFSPERSTWDLRVKDCGVECRCVEGRFAVSESLALQVVALDKKLSRPLDLLLSMSPS